MLLKKDFLRGCRATLIQGREQMRKLDSKNPPAWIRPFQILILQIFFGYFFNSIDPSETWRDQAPSSRFTLGSADAGYCRVVEFEGSCSRQNPNASCAARSDRLNNTHSLAAVTW